MKDNNSENENLIAKVKLLEDEIQKLQDSLESSKQFIDVDATKVPIKLYVIGKYNSFDKAKGVLDVSVEGVTSYYPIGLYGSCRLPFPDSRVLIFNIEGKNNNPYILGFDAGRLIEPAETIRACVSSINYLHSELMAKTDLYGNITMKPSLNFFNNKKIRAGDNLMIRKIQVATEVYFVPNIDEKSIELDNNKMYTFLSKIIK